MKSKDDGELLILAIDAALAASNKILEVYRTDFSVETKADFSPVTLADKLANDIICQKLTATGITILSEEGRVLPWNERKDLQFLWIVDPLDGTKEFIKKNDEFTVNIALAEDGVPVLGVVYCPVLRELYFASSLAGGAYKLVVPEGFAESGQQVNTLLNDAVKLSSASRSSGLNVVVSRSHRNQETDDYITLLRKEYSEVHFLSRGSSLKLCMIAEGVADIYPRFGPTNEWDTAAGHAVVRLSGGEVYQNGLNEPLRYNKETHLNPWFLAVNSNFRK